MPLILDPVFAQAPPMVEKNRQNIMILDPERDTADLFTRALETHDNSYKCYWVMDTNQARSLLAEIPFGLLLADVSTLMRDHFLLLDLVREMSTHTVVIVDAYLDEKNNVKKAMEMGAAYYFIKPTTIGSLRKLIDDFSMERISEV
jgi:DNA-binding response OmpR family regulator